MCDGRASNGAVEHPVAALQVDVRGAVAREARDYSHALLREEVRQVLLPRPTCPKKCRTTESKCSDVISWFFWGGAFFKNYFCAFKKLVDILIVSATHFGADGPAPSEQSGCSGR